MSLELEQMPSGPLANRFRIEFDAYAGPLDLLLYLVRKQELDVLEIPISRITKQYLDMLEVIQLLDLDATAEFVVMASTLVEIKSRLALPQPAAAPDLIQVDDNPRADLVKQLVEYKRFREAAKLLDEHAGEWQQRYSRAPQARPTAGGTGADDRIKEVELWDLVSALSRVLRANSPQAPQAIVYDDTPISTYVERIRARVVAEKRVPFTDLFEGSTLRSKITGIFLAILELMRHYHFRAEQPEPFGEIWVMPPRESDSTPPTEPTAHADTPAAEPPTAQALAPSPPDDANIATGTTASPAPDVVQPHDFTQ